MKRVVRFFSKETLFLFKQNIL